MSKINVLRSLGILFISALCLMACTPEEYGPCSIPNTRAHKTACSPIGNSQTATCAADYVFDCDSFICGIYQSSEPFCTHRCIPTAAECTSAPEFCEKCPDGYSCKGKGECPEGAACVEWIKGTAAYYCLPQDIGFDSAQKVAGNSSSGSDTTEGSSEE